jgi:hypothetical protein
MGVRLMLPLIILLAGMTGPVVVAVAVVVAADHLAVRGLVRSAPLAGFLFWGGCGLTHEARRCI